MIVTIFSRDRGKLTVIARGVLQPKSKYRAVIHPMAHLSTVIYWKEGRELQNLSDAEPVERFPRLMGSLEGMSAALGMLELVHAVTQAEDANAGIFDALVESLRAMERESASEAAVSLWFTIRLASLLGYAIRTDECGVCEERFILEPAPIPFSLAIGAPLCAEHRDAVAYRMLSPEAFDLLATLRTADVEAASRMTPSVGAAVELQDTMASFIRYHVEGLRKLKVGLVAAKVLSEPTTGA